MIYITYYKYIHIFILTTLSLSWKVRKRDPLNTMIGLYLLNCPKGAQTDSSDGKLEVSRAVRQELTKEDYNARICDATFLPNNEAVVSIDNLKPSKNPYLIVPATYGRERTGTFSIEVTSNVEIFLLQGISAYRH